MKKKLFVASEDSVGIDLEDLLNRIVPECVVRNPASAHLIVYANRDDLWRTWKQFAPKPAIIFHAGLEVPGANADLPPGCYYVYGTAALVELCHDPTAVAA